MSQDYAEAVAAARDDDKPAFYGINRTAAAESLQWQREQKPMTADEWRAAVAAALKTGLNR